jgi:hypothetical protein
MISWRKKERMISCRRKPGANDQLAQEYQDQLSQETAPFCVDQGQNLMPPSNPNHIRTLVSRKLFAVRL